VTKGPGVGEVRLYSDYSHADCPGVMQVDRVKISAFTGKMQPAAG
jgi:hypothetical protein